MKLFVSMYRIRHRIRAVGHRSAAVSVALLGVISACFLSGCTAQRGASSADGQPNIIVILADDLGYSDLGSYGGEIDTPNLDRLAEEGLRFTQFYNTSRCVPTRGSLLTGLYPHQAGVGRMTFDAGEPGYRGYLTENTVTIAEVLKQAGYRTGMVGKWHVSQTIERKDRDEQLAWLAHQADYGDFSPREQYPTARGFDDYFGNIWGVVDYFDPFALVNGTEPVKDVPDGYYHTDAISDSAVAYIERYSRGDAPFFLYVAHTAPHWPLHALPEDIAKYEDTYKGGWDAIREARYRRMVDLGIVEDGTALSPRIRPELDWSTNPDSVWDARAMAVHAAMVDRMDRGIGRILAKLEETGELDNTIIFFLSDNGASPERPSQFGPGFDRAGATRDGRKVYFPVDKDPAHLPGPQEVHSGIGPMWSNTVNTPFRWWKAKVHEGGIATPLIVHWPKGLKTPPGTITNQPGHVIDIMATAVELAGASYPTTYEGRTITPLEGKSLTPIFRGETREGHDALFWEHFGARAVRQGNWKLVAPDAGAPWELYNLAEDRTELNNLADAYPEKVAALDSLWNRLAEHTLVVPRPQ